MGEGCEAWMGQPGSTSNDPGSRGLGLLTNVRSAIDRSSEEVSDMPTISRG